MISITPLLAFFKPGDLIRLAITSDAPIQVVVTITVYHFTDVIASWLVQLDGVTAEASCTVPARAGCGYLVHAQAEDQEAFTAFDVLDSWTQAPRYGYLYDFQPNRSGITSTLDHLLALHVNGLQFYDWQYRHDTLLPPHDEFTDPLGRPLSLTTVRTLITEAHQRGMATMPYTAIYAASPAFADNHPNWLLYNAQHEVIDFANGFLKITNPSGPWQDHFIQQCQRVLEALPFDGIHVDQYGEPQTGFDAEGNPVDLAQGFADSLAALKQAIGNDKTVLFNLVHNWPVQAIAASPLAFWYSELWPPETDLTRFWRTIRDNRRLSNRPAILAVYIPPAWEETVLAAQATILAAGGQHIAHGDHERYLSDPYFPKSEVPSVRLAQRLKQLADFSLAYEEALVFADDVTEDWETYLTVNGLTFRPGQMILHAAANRLYINILNAEGCWDTELSAPQTLPNLSIISTRPWEKAWWASPGSPIPSPLTELDLPPIEDWLLVCLEFEENPA